MMGMADYSYPITQKAFLQFSKAKGTSPLVRMRTADFGWVVFVVVVHLFWFYDIEKVSLVSLSQLKHSTGTILRADANCHQF